MTEYRIWRHDSKNIVIQKWRKSETSPPGLWITISYHGNSPASLCSGLFTLIMSQHIPADYNLLKQLETLELAVVSSKEEIKKLIDESH